MRTDESAAPAVRAQGELYARCERVWKALGWKARDWRWRGGLREGTYAGTAMEPTLFSGERFYACDGAAFEQGGLALVRISEFSPFKHGGWTWRACVCRVFRVGGRFLAMVEDGSVATLWAEAVWETAVVATMTAGGRIPHAAGETRARWELARVVAGELARAGRPGQGEDARGVAAMLGRKWLAERRGTRAAFLGIDAGGGA